MTTMKQKLGTALGALALVTGAVPGTIGTAAAVDRGQHLEKPPRDPPIILIILVTAAALGAFFALRGGNDTPVSP